MREGHPFSLTIAFVSLVNFQTACKMTSRLSTKTQKNPNLYYSGPYPVLFYFQILFALSCLVILANGDKQQQQQQRPSPRQLRPTSSRFPRFRTGFGGKQVRKVQPQNRQAAGRQLGNKPLKKSKSAPNLAKFFGQPRQGNANFKFAQ